jgi:hypothetical protein
VGLEAKRGIPPLGKKRTIVTAQITRTQYDILSSSIITEGKLFGLGMLDFKGRASWPGLVTESY